MYKLKYGLYINLTTSTSISGMLPFHFKSVACISQWTYQNKLIQKVSRSSGLSSLNFVMTAVRVNYKIIVESNPKVLMLLKY